jgi:hypothetical protein
MLSQITEVLKGAAVASSEHPTSLTDAGFENRFTRRQLLGQWNATLTSMCCIRREGEEERIRILLQGHQRVRPFLVYDQKCVTGVALHQVLFCYGPPL